MTDGNFMALMRRVHLNDVAHLLSKHSGFTPKTLLEWSYGIDQPRLQVRFVVAKKATRLLKIAMGRAPVMIRGFTATNVILDEPQDFYPSIREGLIKPMETPQGKIFQWDPTPMPLILSSHTRKYLPGTEICFDGCVIRGAPESFQLESVSLVKDWGVHPPHKDFYIRGKDE